MMEEKYREIESIKKKHSRMREILYEFNYFSTDKFNIEIIDPEWTQDEQPWLLEKVLENELSITPYVSPSEQAILDAKAAEDERIRLALLADDFRFVNTITISNIQICTALKLTLKSEAFLYINIYKVTVKSIQ